MAENLDGVPGMTDDECIRAKLTKLVECPVCYETMNITEMCVNGHTVCTRCRGQLSVCPLCSKAFGNVRNLLGEGVAELLAFKRCCYAERGCTKFLSEKACKKHEGNCVFRLYACKECQEQLCFMELKDHFINKHGESMLQPYVTRELMPQEADVGRQYFSLMEFNGELFWFWRRHTEARVHFGLQYCGDAEKVSSYKYNFQVISKSEKSDVEFVAPVLIDVEGYNRYSPSQDYIVLSKNFMGEGAKFQVSIAKA